MPLGRRNWRRKRVSMTGGMRRSPIRTVCRRTDPAAASPRTRRIAPAWWTSAVDVAAALAALHVEAAILGSRFSGCVEGRPPVSGAAPAPGRCAPRSGCSRAAPSIRWGIRSTFSSGFDMDIRRPLPRTAVSSNRGAQQLPSSPRRSWRSGRRCRELEISLLLLVQLHREVLDPCAAVEAVEILQQLFSRATASNQLPQAQRAAMASGRLSRRDPTSPQSPCRR